MIAHRSLYRFSLDQAYLHSPRQMATNRQESTSDSLRIYNIAFATFAKLVDLTTNPSTTSTLPYFSKEITINETLLVNEVLAQL